MKLTPLSLAVCACQALAGPVAGELNFTTWGGSYAQAQVATLVTPFSARTNIKVNVLEYDGGLDTLRSHRAAGKFEWDVVDMSLPDALMACSEGLLEKVDPAWLDAGVKGERAQDDFLPGALSDCMVGTSIWSTVLIYRRQPGARQDPTSIADLFDLAHFPGRRALRKSPEGNLEWALLADGVPVEQVYAVLSTREGVDRALRKLGSIKASVVWWESGAAPMQLLASGEVVMASAYNNRAYVAMKRIGTPLRFMWDGQLLNLEGLAIVKGSRNLAAAKEFLRQGTQASTQAAMANMTALGPSRQSAAPLVDPVQQHLLPTATWYRNRSITVDPRWWEKHGTALQQRFKDWLMQ